MQKAFNSGNRERVQQFALCSAACVIGCSVFFVSWAIGHNTREELEKLAHTPAPVFNLNEDYRAKHDVSDVIIFSIFAVGSALVAFRLAADGRHLLGAVLLSAMAIFSLACLYRSLFFSVLFTEREIVVQMKPFMKYSESYDSVVGIHFMPGNLKVLFSNGKSVNLGGLGDSRRITAILEKHVNVVPEQRVHWL